MPEPAGKEGKKGVLSPGLRSEESFREKKKIKEA